MEEDNYKPIADELITLRAKKVGIDLPLHPQILHDLNVSQDYDPYMRTGIIRLRSLLYESQVEEQIKEVELNHHTTVKIPGALLIIILAYNLPLIIYASFYDYSVFIWIAISWIMPLVLWKCGWDDIVKGKVTIKKQDWATFPENEKVFPKVLGSPVIHTTFQEKVEINGNR